MRGREAPGAVAEVEPGDEALRPLEGDVAQTHLDRGVALSRGGRHRDALASLDRAIAREDSAWYSSARLFHQQAPGDWDEVAARVAAELAGLARLGPGDVV
jgi:hypothetical protein